MALCARVGDSVATGHLCDATTTLAFANHNVNAQGANALRRGDATVTHEILEGIVCVPHVETIKAGSSKVTIGGIPAARLGDACDAGSITSGASKVNIGG